MAESKAPAERFQLCLAHQLRDLERLIEQRPRLQWAVEMQELFREAIHLWKRVYVLTLDGYLRRVFELEGRLDRLLERRVEGPAAQRLWERYLKHRDQLRMGRARLCGLGDGDRNRQAARPSGL